YAHQGGAREAPSSTLNAIERAIGLGCNAIELDIHMTSDERLVACHDPTVDRTTNATGAISDYTLAELEELDNAYWFVEGQDVQHDRAESEYTLRGRAPKDHAYGIATLDEIIDLTDGILLNLDIKKTAPDVPPYEEAIADLLRKRHRTEDVIVASFIDSASRAFKAYAPEIATSAGTNAVADFFRAVRAGEVIPAAVKTHVAVQVPASFQGIVVVDEQFVSAAHQAGLAVHVWTINERDEMERLCDLGVDGIISDTPSVLVDVLSQRELNWRTGAPA
ncbi:MAG TPA: glycerophosphodiester phosphodiesterase, partial [Acidimicrobiales bacterium]|nr:glycerophosphodiester phosphodiesterase [Acidimicrobiales bacterium]